jgi:hypothetical protein
VEPLLTGISRSGAVVREHPMPLLANEATDGPACAEYVPNPSVIHRTTSRFRMVSAGIAHRVDRGLLIRRSGVRIPLGAPFPSAHSPLRTAHMRHRMPPSARLCHWARHIRGMILPAPSVGGCVLVSPPVARTAAPRGRVQIPRSLLYPDRHGGLAPAVARRRFVAERVGTSTSALDDARRELLAAAPGGPYRSRSAPRGAKRSVRHAALRLPRETGEPFAPVPTWSLDP